MRECCRPEPYRWLSTFRGFTDFTTAIPKLYFDVDSAEQRYHLLCEQLHKLICYIDYVGDKVNIDHNEIEKLKEQFQKFMESGFEDYYIEQIYKWIDDHMEELITYAVKMVFFGLTDDGYFVAYIPDSWDEILFDTGAVYGTDEYGRLILNYDVYSDHDVNQDWITNKKILEDVRKRVTQTEETLYTPMREGGLR